MKKLLVVVDFQNDFVNGALGFDKAKTLDGPIAAKIEQYRKNGDTVAFTFDTHGPDYLKTREGINLPVPHCEKGGSGWRLFGKTAALLQEGDPVFEKPSFGSFAFAEYLRNTPFSSIEFVGIVTNMCVLSNVVLALAAVPETPVLVDASCCASFDETLHEKALDVLVGLYVTILNRN